MSEAPFAHIALIGLGLLGSSLAQAIRAHLPGVRVTGYDASPDVRARAGELGLTEIRHDPADAVAGADLGIRCVPVGAIAAAARALSPGLSLDAVVSDVGSSKQSVASALAEAKG